jgi:hypothetical protein
MTLLSVMRFEDLVASLCELCIITSFGRHVSSLHFLTDD